MIETPNVKSTANLQGFADGLLHNLGVASRNLLVIHALGSRLWILAVQKISQTLQARGPATIGLLLPGETGRTLESSAEYPNCIRQFFRHFRKRHASVARNRRTTSADSQGDVTSHKA